MGKGKDERVKREKIGRGRIAHFDFPPFLRPATQATPISEADSREALMSSCILCTITDNIEFLTRVARKVFNTSGSNSMEQ